MKSSAYQSLYNSLYADKDYEGEVATVLKACRQPIRSLLDSGCGTGKHAGFFASRGIAVTGVDVDCGMIKMAKESLSHRFPKKWPRPRFYVGGPEAAPPGPYDAATCLFNVVNYVTKFPDLVTFFSRIAERLPGRAPLVFDAWNGLAALLDPPKTKSKVITRAGTRFSCTTRSTVNLWRQLATLKVDIAVEPPLNGIKRATHRFVHRLWTPQDLIGALGLAGFTTPKVATWNNLNKTASVHDWKLLFIARKK